MKTFIIVLIALCTVPGYTQPKPSLDDLNRAIDQAVIHKDVKLLQDAYAPDFVFTHGTGHIDSKDSWLTNVGNAKTHFLSRDHDSTQVELHDDVGIVTGKLSIARQEEDKVVRYAIRYVRVYAWRNKRWQMLSHRTVKQWDF